MKARPITLRGHEVRAALAGDKSQHRVPVKPQPHPLTDGFVHRGGAYFAPIVAGYELGELPVERVRRCPYKPGELRWARETHAVINSEERYPPPFGDDPLHPIRRVSDPEWGDYWQQCHYRATDPEPELDWENDDSRPRCRRCEQGVQHTHWRPSIHMPRWAARLWLQVDAVRVERVQEITYAEVRHEGVACPEHDFHGGFCCSPCPALRDAWIAAWDRINGKRAPWASNPWVWVVTFHRVERPAEETA